MFNKKNPLRLGSRASPLALYQAYLVRDLLIHLHPNLAEPDGIQIIPMTTRGDTLRDRALADFGGKGLFITTLEEAILAGHIHAAVHALKDVPSCQADDFMLVPIGDRCDPHDGVVSRGNIRLADLPEGSWIGSASPRRRALLRHHFPHLRLRLIRGNVRSRLKAVRLGYVDATLLAVSGLKRLKLMSHLNETLDLDQWPPAVGQSIIAVELAKRNEDLCEIFTALQVPSTAIAAEAERALARTLEAHCASPLAGYCTWHGAQHAELKGLLAFQDGLAPIKAVRATRLTTIADARRLGADLGEELLAQAGPAMITCWRNYHDQDDDYENMTVAQEAVGQAFQI